MKILSEAILPRTCYVAEVALWLSLGRVPRVLFKHSDFGENYQEETGDPRSCRGALDKDAAIISYDSGFSSEEFRAIGIEPDFERYSLARRYTAKIFPHLRLPITGERALEDLSLAEHYANVLGKERLGYVPAPLSDEEVAKRKIIAAELDWATEVDAKCDAFIDLARADVFRSLTSGTLKAYGWKEAPGQIGYKDREGVPLIPISADQWTFRNFDWDESTLHTADESFYAVQVYTKDMLATFPRPQSPHTPASMECFPSCIIIDEGSLQSARAPVAPKAGRGRPAKGDGLIRKAVINVFSDKARKGELPEKSEAIIQQIIEYVGFVFEETVSRSTAQQYLRALPINVPENRAG